MPEYFYRYVNEDMHLHLLISEGSENKFRKRILEEGRITGTFFVPHTGEIRQMTANSVPMLTVSHDRMQQLMIQVRQKIEGHIQVIDQYMPA